MRDNNATKKGVIYYGKKVLGIILIVLGIIGLFLPFLQGIAMILVGIALLGGKPAIRRCKRLAMRLLHVWRRVVKR